MSAREKGLWAALFALVMALQIASITRQSLTGDEQQHLLAGHQAWRYGTNTLNLEHPPLAKLVAAAPALLLEPLAPPMAADELLPALSRLFEEPARAARARLGGRLAMLAVFGVPWLVTAAALGRRFAGARAGLALAAALGLALSVLPHLALAHTDAAVALGFTLVLLTGMRFVDEPSPGRAAALGLALAVALATKFSGLLAIPAVVVAMILAPRDRLSPARRALAALMVVLVAATAVAAIYRLANLGYRSVDGRRAIELYASGRSPVVVDDRLAGWAPRLLALESVSPAAAQYATGLASAAAQNAIGVYPAYFFGEVSSRGRLEYFPAVFALKTPLALLLASGAGLFAIRRREKREGASAATWLAGTTLAVYLLAALYSNYNIGIRHLLPVMPLLLLPAARWAAASARRSALLAGALAIEAILLAPRWVSATNLWFLGAANPARFALSTSDSEMHQSFLLLAAAARERGIEEIAILYPLLDRREARAYLPDSRVLEPGESPRPGWYAVSILVEQYVPALLAGGDRPLRDRAGLEALARALEPTWEAIRRGDDHGYVAGTFHLYRIR